MLARLQHIGRVQCRRLLIARALATGSATSPPASSATASASAPAPVPWFVDPQPVNPPQRVSPLSRATAAPPVPQDAPAVLKDLQAELVQSPHIDVSTLLVTQAVPPAPGPPLPPRAGQGKRNRGATFAGESEFQNLSGIWSWYMFVQVKEGTEGRGGIEAVVRHVRKTLLARTPPVTLPPKSRRQLATGWALVDGGNFAVHVLSKETREKYFSDIIPQ